MTAMRRALVLGLALLTAAAAAVAETIVTADEVICCWEVEAADDGSVRFTLPRLERRTLSACDVYEVRLSDSGRIAALAAQLPQLKVTFDSGQPIPPSAVRAREMLRLRLERVREARAKGFPGYAGVVDTLPRRTSPKEMVARCRDMDIALCECGPGDSAVVDMLREVNREHDALRRIWPQAAGRIVCGGCGALLGGLTGGLIGAALHPQEGSFNFGEGGWSPGGGGCVGCPVGCAVGSVIGVAIAGMQHRNLIARHRDRVNDLVCRVNLAVVTTP